MYLPPLQMPAFLDRVMIGDVQIDPSAAIAPGVILQADPSSSIVIGAGVCIGMGVILHAQTGKLAIGVSTNLGAGVLIVGKGEIGANCCIGSCSTLINCNLPSGTIIAAGKLLENNSELLEMQKEESIPTDSLVENEAGESKAEIKSESAAIALNHAKAHLNKFAKKINLL